MTWFRNATLIATLIVTGPACMPPASPAAKNDVADPESPTAAADPVSEGMRCDHHDPERQAFWGDLHVHTALSSDAWRSDVRTVPDDAYRFARGEAILIPPLDETGRGTRSVRLDRPLDFTAVTDHAERLGATRLCGDPESAAWDSEGCRFFRRLPATPAFRADPDLPPRAEIIEMICGADHQRCIDAARTPWQETRAAANRWMDDTAACAFTTFVAYEWSGARDGPLLHRNVIFRNEHTPAPVGSIQAPRPWDLFTRLESECLDADDGCDVISIPHNSNTSQGMMFALDYPLATNVAEEADLARRRAALEPVIEIMQHKGDSECRNGLSGVLGDPDELCDFEKLFPAALPECRGDEDKTIGAVRCTDVGGFGRYGLAIGMAEKERIGANPFRFGFLAATDTHNATAGQVDETTWKGHVGTRDDRPATRMGAAGAMNNTVNNPGGLAGVWAEQNTRDALFDAIRRRETFGTSGPRITVRFFGGWDYPEDLCEKGNLVGEGYAGGVAMGDVLDDMPIQATGEALRPTFALHALADPGSRSRPGGLLQRAQVVKVWNDGSGAIQQRIYDVAGDPANAASVDLATCEPRGEGARELCRVWRDPEFDPGTPAVYYARIVENPSCRWSTSQCLGLPEDARPPGCNSARLPKVVQERAWTSPIWYEPQEETEQASLSIERRATSLEAVIETGESRE
jgi:hypothetical protein